MCCSYVFRIEEGEEDLPCRIEADVKSLEYNWGFGLLQDFVAEEGNCFFGVGCGRFLEKNMFASFDGFESPFVVKPVWEGDIDRIDVLVFDQLWERKSALFLLKVESLRSMNVADSTRHSPRPNVPFQGALSSHPNVPDHNIQSANQGISNSARHSQSANVPLQRAHSLRLDVQDRYSMYNLPT